MSGQKIKMGDVARASGVSRATVDRVLNNRAGVRPETVRKVERALAELGYAPSSLKALSQSVRAHVSFVLTDGTNPFFDVIQRGVLGALGPNGFQGVSHDLIRFDPYLDGDLVRALHDVPQRADAVVMVGCDVPEVASAIDRLVDRGVRVVTVISDVPNSQRSVFIGQDNYAAGRTAGRLMAQFVPPGPGKIGVFLGHYQFRHLMDRMAGLRQSLGLMRPDLTIVQPPPHGNDPKLATEALNGLRREEGDLKGVYIVGGGQPIILASLKDLEFRDLVVIGHEISKITRSALLDGRISALLGVDINLIGERAVRAALNLSGAEDLAPCPINIFLPENLPK